MNQNTQKTHKKSQVLRNNNKTSQQESTTTLDRVLSLLSQSIWSREFHNKQQPSNKLFYPFLLSIFNNIIRLCDKRVEYCTTTTITITRTITIATTTITTTIWTREKRFLMRLWRRRESTWPTWNC